VAVKRDAADIWFSKAIRARDGECVVCGKQEALECCHIYGRRNKAVRWSMDNAITMCHYHHRWTTENPLEMARLCEQLLGCGHMEILREKSQAILKTTKQLREEVAKHYREEVRQREIDPDYEIISYN